MAKPLRQTQPSSAVARFFDATAVARAIGTNHSQPESTVVAVDVEPELVASSDNALPICKREIILTASTAETLDRLVNLYRLATGTRLTMSHAVRSVLLGIEHAFTAIEQEARGMPKTKLPSNARERIHERQEFERQLAAAFVAGMRATSSMARN